MPGWYASLSTLKVTSSPGPIYSYVFRHAPRNHPLMLGIASLWGHASVGG